MAAANENIARPHDIQEFTDLDGATGVHKEGVSDGLYTTFWKFYTNGEAYFAQIFKPRLDIRITEVKEALRRVPDTDIVPEIPEAANLKVATTSGKPDDEIYIKRPSLLTYETSDPLELVRDIFLGEAEIMGQVSSINHKNIIRYHGCQVRDGRLTGIVLERHKCSLFEYFLWGWDKDAALDSRRFMEELESAVSHLHQAGLAHNDLKPSNILLNKEKCRCSSILDLVGHLARGCWKEGRPAGATASSWWSLRIRSMIFSAWRRSGNGWPTLIEK